ncbi:MAG: hypothetical protein QW336_02035 [Candidatus Anstonellales archaeon]
MKVTKTTPPAYIEIEYVNGLKDYVRDKVAKDLNEISNRFKISWGTFIIKIQLDPSKVLHDTNYERRTFQEEGEDIGILVEVFRQPFELGALFPYDLKEGQFPYIYISFTSTRYLLDNLKQATDLVSRNYKNNLPIYLDELGFGVFIDPIDSGVLTFKNTERIVQLDRWLNYFESFPKPIGLDQDNRLYMSVDNWVLYIEPQNINIKLLMSR